MKLETIEKILNFIRLKEDKEIPQKWYANLPKLNLIKNLENHPDGVQYKYGGDLDLSGSSIKKLPNQFYIMGDLDLSGCEELKFLPFDLYVRGLLDLFNTNIKKLPDDLYVGSNLLLDGCTELTEIPNNLYVGGNIYLRETPLANKYTIEEIRKIVTSTGGIIKGNLVKTWS